VRPARPPLLAAAIATTTLALAALGLPDGPPTAPVRETSAAIVRVAEPPAAPAVRASAPARPAPPRTVSLVMGGDLLWHNTVWQSAAADAVRTGAKGRYDFDPMFAALRPLVRGADLALCHEEVPFAAPGQPPQSYPVFAAPPEVAAWIAGMGFDACTTASNHTVDQGFAGLVRTADLLEAHGVAHVGTFRTAAERRRPVILTTEDGVRVGLVAGTYGLNGFPLPEGRPWSVSMADADTLLDQARRARRAGADIVVVHVHHGDEYSPTPNADQVALVERLTRSPAVDLVLGEHAHVVQPITKVNGTWVVYGMGNMVAQQDPAQPRTYEGILVRFRFEERPCGRFRVRDAAYVPTYWNHIASGPVRVRRVVAALEDATGPDRARLLQARAAVRAAVHALGHTPGLRER